MKPSYPALGIPACIAVAALLLPGCQATDGSSRASSGSGSGGVSVADPRVAAEIEQKYVVGPNAARELDYSIDWQYLEGGSNLKQLSVQGDSVFALDGRNFLTRIKKDDG